MNPNELPRHDGARVWVKVQGERMAMWLHAKPPHDSYLTPDDLSAAQEKLDHTLAANYVVLTVAQIEALRAGEGNALESNIEITVQPPNPEDRPDCC